MKSNQYHYEPKCVDDIVIRAFAFEFPDDLDPLWHPQAEVRSHLFNGFSLTMPYLEPFLIKNMQEASTHIDHPELLNDIRAFNGQEARHYQCHRRLNELLKANGYPVLAKIEDQMAESWATISKWSLEARLAYGAGFESMTNGFTHWFINRRRELFGGADPHVSSFWLMHMVEETEHKTVAFDAFMAYSGRFWPRILGVFRGSFHIFGFGVLAMLVTLHADGKLSKLRTWLEIAREIGSLGWHVGPYLLRALLPWHNPRCEGDPQWMLDWCKGHTTHPRGEPLPLVDTSHPDLPVPFNVPS